MNNQKYIAVLVLAGIVIAIVVFWFARRPESSRLVTSGGIANQAAFMSVEAATNESIMNLHKLLVDDYNSTNSHDSVTSLITHQLIAESLRTNGAFLEWATNVATAVIMRFVTNSSIPVYGIAGLTPDALSFEDVSADAPRGLQVRAVFDPNPSNEGPLIFIVEGGVHPTIQLIENPFRVESYQLNPDSWQRSRRNVRRMDWSVASTPLDSNSVDEIAQKAFFEMTLTNLQSFKVATKINIEKFLNTNAKHPEVTVTGNPNFKLFTPKDYVYPFATFEYHEVGGSRMSFSGEMAQTAPGQGEFVKLLAVNRNPDALFELGEKFLGVGTWEGNMLEQVNSMNTTQRGEVYRRLFAH